MRRFPITAILALSGLLCLTGVRAGAQVRLPPLEESGREPLGEAASWADIGGYHAARQELEGIFSRLVLAHEKRDALFLLMESTFEDQEYEEAFQWSDEFLLEYPHDAEHASALFINGVSAFQTRRGEVMARVLDEFLGSAGDHPRKGAAAFWRAMGKLERGDWQGAEGDVRRVYEDTTAGAYRDIALMGWGLSLEHRGEYAQAIGLFERFLKEFPESSLLPEVRVRLASLSMRLGRPETAARYLEASGRPARRAAEEYTLLKAESEAKLSRYAPAEADYRRFLDEFPESRYNGTALYGLAWTLLKRGDPAGARRAFDSLGRTGDSLAIAALYQSGLIALLQDEPVSALRRFDTLTMRSPYDSLAEKSYIQAGLAHYRARRYRDARRMFRLAAELFPGSPRQGSSYHMLGESDVALGSFSNAQYDFSQVRRIGASPDQMARSMFQEGVCLYHLGRFKTSAEIFGGYLGRFPSDPLAPEGYVWRGEALYQDYRFAEAERAFSEALELSPGSAKRADALYGLAWSLFEQKKFSQAAETFERYGREFPGDSRSLDASLRKADCYFFMGQYEKARSMYTALSAGRADDRNVEYAAFQVAMSYIQRGESERGIEGLRSFLGRFPASVFCEVAQFNIGWEYFSKERYAEALAEFRAVLAKYPYGQLTPRVLFNTGDAFYNLKQYDSARTCYRRVITEYPQSLIVPDAVNGLQFTYEAEGRPAGTIAAFDTLLAEKTTGVAPEELTARKGDILMSQNDYAGAIQEYQRVLLMKPTPAVEARALRQLGRAYEMENNLSQAAISYGRVLKEHPDADGAPQTALALGTVYLRMKEFREASGTLAAMEEKYPGSPLLGDARYSRGLALAALGDSAGALGEFLSAIGQNPSDIVADRSRLRAAEILSSERQYAPAIDTLTGVAERRSDELAAEALYLIGGDYLALKRTKDALQAFTDLIRQYTDFPLWVGRAHIGSGDAYRMLRETRQARNSYEEAARSADPEIRKTAQERLKKVRR